jgi:hypothetical protein
VNLLSVRQHHVEYSIVRGAVVGDVNVVIAGPAFTERTSGRILAQIRAAENDRNDVRKVQVGFGAPEQTGRGVDRLGAITLLGASRRILRRAADHRTAEFPDANARIGDYLTTVSADTTLAVDIPAVASGFVVPEVKTNPRA